MSISHTGEKHHNWLGGKSFEPYSLDFTKRFKKLIRNRDNNKCFICEKFGDNVHHIDYNKNNCSPDNLITLCYSCHAKTNINRNKWIEFFKK
jgi:5-methylcytosine-specific restriction endonuclease McrA